MNKENILGFPFYRFYYEKNKIDFISEELEKLSYRPNPNNMIWTGVTMDGKGKNLHDLPQFKDIFKWFHNCLNEVKKDLKLTCDKLTIVSSWSNIAHPGQSFHGHKHPNCFISSNYYAKGSKNDKTVWQIPNPYFDNSNIHPFGMSGDKEELYYLKHYESTEPGKFVVFPPSIFHYATKNTTNTNRVTIAANAYPEGLITCGNVSKMKIKIIK